MTEQDAHDAAAFSFRVAANRKVIAAVAIHVPQRRGGCTTTTSQLGAVLARVDHGLSALLGALDVEQRGYPDVVDPIAVVVACGAHCRTELAVFLSGETVERLLSFRRQHVRRTREWTVLLF